MMIGDCEQVLCNKLNVVSNFSVHNTFSTTSAYTNNNNTSIIPSIKCKEYEKDAQVSLSLSVCVCVRELIQRCEGVH